jgi:hypothetical protein
VPNTAAATAERAAATRELMKLTWDYPVYAATEGPRSDDTAVKAKRTALTSEEALKVIAGKDPRPLLVVRECDVCNKTDDALLTPGTDNEKTLIYSRWFHCVKLPVDVRKDDHPFHALFPLADAEHLFVSAADGSGRIPLESDTSRTDLWASMNRVLSDAYATSPTEALKSITAHIDRIDGLNQKLASLETKLGELMEKPSVDKAKVKAVQDDVDETKALVAAEKAGIEKLARLELRTAPTAKPEVPAKAGN